MKRVVWLFSGQGAQYFQMGRELFAQEPVFRAAIERLDAVVRPLLGESVADEIYRERADRFLPFRCIRHTHPAIVMVECALAELLLADPARWNRAALDAAVAAGETRTVRLAKKVPVLIIYWTADRDDDGSVVFKPDPYSRDVRELAALDAPFRRSKRPAF